MKTNSSKGGRPPKPVVNILPPGESTITVQWQQPFFSTTCDVAFGTDKDKLPTVGISSSGLWNIPKVDLDPEKEYFIRVRGFNSIANGDWSDTVKIPRLKEEVKPQPTPQPIPATASRGETAPIIDTKGKPASVATPNWFFRNWGKIRQSRWLSIVAIWLIIIGLILAAYVLTHKKMPRSITKAPVAEVVKLSVIPPIADVSTARDNSGEKLATAARGGIAMVNSVMININQVAPTENRVSEQNWPAQKLPDMSYNLAPGTMEYSIPPGADYVFCPPPPEQGVFSTYPVLIEGNPNTICIAQNGVRWDRRWNNSRDMPIVHQYRYWNRSSESARMRMNVVPMRHH
jgi:hypothetical protein